MKTGCQTTSSALKNFPEYLGTLLLLVLRGSKFLAVRALSAPFSGFSYQGGGGAVPTCGGHGGISVVLVGDHFQPSHAL